MTPASVASLAKRVFRRENWVRLHRWAGLYMALFVFVAGVTGSILAFKNPIDRWLNAERDTVAVTGPTLDPLALYDRAVACATPEERVNVIPLELEAGRTVAYYAEPIVDPATGKPFERPGRQLYLNPYTGELVCARVLDDSIWPVTRENFIGFVYSLHFSLAIPGSLGTWLFGVAATLWTIDCFVGAYLTFPLRRRDAGGASKGWWSRWRPSWLVRMTRGGYRFTFDLHRAAGLWVWLMLFVYAWSSVGLTFGDQVYTPVMSLLFDMRQPGGELPVLEPPLEHPVLTYAAALGRARELARAKADELGFALYQERQLALDADHGVYGYDFASSSDIGVYGGASIQSDANTGDFRSVRLQDRQPVGLQLSDWLFTLHFGSVWGLPMKMFICLMGLLIATLSVTGVAVWWRKRGSRVKSSRRARQRSSSAAPQSPADAAASALADSSRR